MDALVSRLLFARRINCEMNHSRSTHSERPILVKAANVAQISHIAQQHNIANLISITFFLRFNFFLCRSHKAASAVWTVTGPQSHWSSLRVPAAGAFSTKNILEQLLLSLLPTTWRSLNNNFFTIFSFLRRIAERLSREAAALAVKKKTVRAQQEGKKGRRWKREWK